MSLRTAELGDTLRGWRDRLTPEVVGLPTYGQRRAAGLRREELAFLAGLSVDYVTRLEQGRATNPSVQVLAALSRALRLTRAQRDHLYTLAGQAPPHSGVIDAHLTPGVQRLLSRLEEFPVSVVDPAWNIVAWNPLWEALVGEPAGESGRLANIIWRHFTGIPGRIVPDGESHLREDSMVADLRAAQAKYPHDADLASLIADLRTTSARFEGLWQRGDVESHVASRKAFDHPSVGHIAVDCDVMTVHNSDLRIVAYTTEPGTQDAEKLNLLRVVGTQQMSG